MAEVETLVLLDTSPLKSVNGVSFQESLVLGGSKRTARTPFGLDGEIRFRDPKRFKRRFGFVGERRCHFEGRGISAVLSRPGGI